MCNDLKHDFLEILYFWYCSFLVANSYPFELWHIHLKQYVNLEKFWVKVNNVNLYFNNSVQIFYSAKQFRTLFILLGCKYMNADIIQILHILLLKRRFSLHSFWLWLDVDFSLPYSVLEFPLKSGFLRFIRSRNDFTSRSECQYLIIWIALS